jgi:hypothetical protein
MTSRGAYHGRSEASLGIESSPQPGKRMPGDRSFNVTAAGILPCYLRDAPVWSPGVLPVLTICPGRIAPAVRQDLW